MYDLIIVGAGPAGITASVYAARKRMNFLVISKDIGGYVALSGDIENYTGYQFITGTELVAKFQQHMQKYNVVVREDEEVIHLERKNNLIQVKTNKEGYQAKVAIVASGARPRALNVTGEKEFKSRGLTYCATCDAPLFANKDVAVIGGGNSGLEATLQLMNIASVIYLIDAASDLAGDPIMQEKIKKSDKVTILANSQVVSIEGDKMVKSIKIKKPDGEEELNVQGVFVEIGLMPNSEFVYGVEKNDNNEIKVNCCNETDVEGIYAAGDVTDVCEKQIVIAAGEGAKALNTAFRYLASSK